MSVFRSLKKNRREGLEPRILFHVLSSIAVTLAVAGIVIAIAVKLNTAITGQVIERHQREQLISVFHQSARLGDTLKTIVNDLLMLSTHKELIEFQETGARKLLRNFYENHHGIVVAGYRMDNAGILRYVEGRDKQGEGFDISGQQHVKDLFASGAIVTSGSFKAVEGYYGMAIHVPVLKDGRLDGSVATLVNWDGFQEWFTRVKTAPNCFTMLLDKEHKIIFHPDPGFIGRTIEASPVILKDGEPVPPSFYYTENTGILSGPFFGDTSYVAACYPFTFEGVPYALVNCAPYEDILSPLYQTSILTALLAGFSILGALLTLGYFFFGLRHDRKNRIKCHEETRERKRAEQSLTETQDTFLTVLNSIDATIYVADMETYEILFMNRYMEESFKTTEWQNKKCHKLFRKSSNPCSHCSNAKLLDAEGNPTGVHIWEGKNPVTGKWYHNFDRAIKWIDGRIVRIQIATDITSIKTYEEQQREMAEKLQRAQKMEAIGTLAGGVAHDLNNVLSGIVTYPELILMDIPEDSPLVPSIKAIQDSGVKASEIVSDLLTLGRRGVTISEVVDLNEVIKGYMGSPEFAKLKSYHTGIRIRSYLDAHLATTKGSPIHLRKTVMNLISNAAEAHPSGKGRVEISTQNRYVDSPLKGYDHVIEGEYIVIRVTDNGTGIPEEDQHRIFEPFYTKKVMGRSGTGLGMAVVWGTVQDHAGYICLDSREGAGTSISVYFPASVGASVQKAPLIPLETFKGKKQSVLVVDDVSDQRIIAAGILNRLNYKVTTAPSGEHAIDCLKERGFDPLLLDMIMEPGMDGLDTYKKALEFNPHQKALIASGYSETLRVKEALDLGAGAYIKKPYRMEDIGKAVKTELARE